MIASPVYSAQFLADLEAIYHQSMVVSPSPVAAAPAVDLDWLAGQFRTWRTNQQRRLRQFLDRLPADDPLFCPVSLFGTMDYGRLETAHTRTLAWLLNPNAEHGFGDRMLRAVLRAIDGPDAIEVKNVASEFAISRDDDSGRLDVVVWGQTRAGDETGEPWLLVIEGKVDAMEGNEQLARYDRWIELTHPDRKVFRVFLTPTGHAAETGVGDWQPMSFLRLACILREAMPAVRGSPGYHFLVYYLAGVLMDVCKWSLPIKPDTHDPYGVVEYVEAVLGPTEVRGTANGKAR